MKIKKNIKKTNKTKNHKKIICVKSVYFEIQNMSLLSRTKDLRKVINPLEIIDV